MRFHKAELKFWVAFLSVNFFFFLPVYILNSAESSFLPATTLPPGESLGWVFHLFARDNQDIFRLSADWMLIATILLVFRKWRFQQVLFIISILAYFILFGYQLYLAFSLKTYGEIPNFGNDKELIQEVLPIFLDQSSQGNVGWIYVLGGLSLLGLVGIVFLLIRWYVRQTQKIQLNKKWLIGGIMAWMITTVFLYKNGHSSYPPTFNSVQLTASPFYKSLKELKPKATEMLEAGAPYEDFFTKPLTQKPNVYLLFIESYGEVLYTHESLHAPYLQLLTSVEDSLKVNGFHSQSALSESPVLGGRSWLAFTSALCGITLDNQLMFNELLRMPEYPHLVHFFNQQGYETIRIKSMSDNESHVKAAYKKPTQFYCFDQWLKYNDFPYHGYKYDWFGGMPDQFVLNYVEEEVRQDSLPLFLFYINMNSHGPWFPQAPVYEDWRMLDTIPRVPDEAIDYQALLAAPVADRYMDAISYQLTYLTQFIVQHADSTDIFVLIGDHQPAIIYRQGIDGFNTPLHIISKDASFVDQFAKQGFFPGLQITDLQDTTRQVKHADLYPLLVEALLR